MKHASPSILGDLDKMHSDHASEIRRVANSDTSSGTPKGASRRLPQVDMSKKIGPHRDVARPNPVAPSRDGSTKPLNSPWPTSPIRLESGKARPTWK